MSTDGNAGLPSPALNGWYDLFSRGSRDWLRHNEKVREAVREHLPQIIAGGDVISHGARTVRVPVRMLEHYRFQLRASRDAQGVGQGKVKPGDVLGRPSEERGAGRKGEGGTERGGIDLMLEFKVDDIIDWLWEELRLPNLQARIGPTEQSEWTREGWDRRGVRSRLDRRRSLREAVKRRALDPQAPGFLNEDLRFRQLTRRRQPTTRAVVFLLLDVSGSMTERDRQLAKSFFFWVVAGLRREYHRIEIVLVAHTTDAWEFSETEFFQVTGAGGTIASSGLMKVREIVRERYDPATCNVYLFYASDGDNASDDRAAARHELSEFAAIASYTGYVEIGASSVRMAPSETSALFDAVVTGHFPGGSFALNEHDDVWNAVRHFFSAEAQAAGAPP